MLATARRYMGRDATTSEVAGYPVSREAAERVRNARERQAVFQARHLLAQGGFSGDEIEALIEVVRPHFRNATTPTAAELAGALKRQGFNKADAEALAQALASKA